MVKLTQITKILFLYFLWEAAVIFSSNLIFFYFKNAGVSTTNLLLGEMFLPIAALLSIWAVSNKPKVDMRLLMAAGSILCLASFVLLLVFPPTSELLFTYFLAYGAACFFFWVPFNVMYFELASEKAATFGTIYVATGSILSVVLPLVSGYVAESFGFFSLFLVSAVAFVLPTAAIFLLKPRSYEHSLQSSLAETKGFKTLSFLDGIGSAGPVTVIAIISLSYFNEPIGLSIFVSVTTLFSVLASFLVSKLSDQNKKRKIYLTIFSFAATIATLSAAFFTGLIAWYAATSARNFFFSLFYPFTTAIFVDNKREMIPLMVGREWSINLGRFVGMLVVITTYIATSSLYLALASVGWVLLLYPVIIELKRRHISVD